jgi:hypothetical protein
MDLHTPPMWKQSEFELLTRARPKDYAFQENPLLVFELEF